MCSLLHPSSASTTLSLAKAGRDETRAASTARTRAWLNSARHLISHACPEAVPFSTRASSLLFVAVPALPFQTFRHSLFILDCLLRLRWPSPLLPCAHSLARLPRQPTLLPSSVLDQHRGSPSHNGSLLSLRQPACHIAGSVCLPADRLHLPNC